MSELVVIEYVSLDGVIQAPGHADEDRDDGFAHGGWTGPWIEEHGPAMLATFRAAGGMLLGRRTYDIWAPYWPTASDELAVTLNALPKYVVSTTLTDPSWEPTTVFARVDEVAGLREAPGEDIVLMGSGELARALAERDLVDRYVLWAHPVALGSGKRLFARDGGPARAFRLVDCRTTASGLVITTHERDRP